MLVDEEYTNILPLPGKAVESILDLRLFCLGVHHQEVAFRIGRIRDMPYASEEQSRNRTRAVSKCPHHVRAKFSLFIANDRDELTVLPGVRARCTHTTSAQTLPCRLMAGQPWFSESDSSSQASVWW
jgi:hypothetical protein